MHLYSTSTKRQRALLLELQPHEKMELSMSLYEGPYFEAIAVDVRQRWYTFIFADPDMQYFFEGSGWKMGLLVYCLFRSKIGHTNQW